jgi:hypothetical protein
MKSCKFCNTPLIKDENWRYSQYNTGSKVCHNCKLEYQRNWRKENPGSFKEWKYGLTEEAYNTLLDKQRNKCAICGTTSPGGRHNKFHIDHDHTTGKVRGLLCWSCNAGLGQFKDNEYLLIEAHNYLVKSRYED